MRGWLLGAVWLLGCGVAVAAPCDAKVVDGGWMLAAGGGKINVRLDGAAMTAGADPVLVWVCDAATAVSVYFGRFPAPVATVAVQVRAGRHGVLGGTTWGGHRDVEGPLTRMTVGADSTAADFGDDWTMTHELTHMAFPQMPDESHWMEEGMATYIEPIARVQSGQLTAERVWHDVRRDMRKGEPAEGDQGLSNTHTWGRTYWGGAMFWFAADVEIRKQTRGKFGLQDAMRGILAAGGNISQDWSEERALTEGDRVTGTHVLVESYRAAKDKAVTVDLDALWKQLGVTANGAMDDKAPLASVRRAIMAKR